MGPQAPGDGRLLPHLQDRTAPSHGGWCQGISCEAQGVAPVSWAPGISCGAQAAAPVLPIDKGVVGADAVGHLPVAVAVACAVVAGIVDGLGVGERGRERGRGEAAGHGGSQEEHVLE